MENKDKYDLYTEHVFPDKVKKKRKIIRRVVSVTGLAVLFGIVSSGIMLLTYKLFIDEEKPQKQPATVAVAVSGAETTTEPVSDDKEKPLTDKRSHYDEVKESIRKITKSHVTITVGESEDEKNTFEGFIFSKADNDYYILTEYSKHITNTPCYVEFNTQEPVECTYVGVDSNTNLAVLKAEAMESISVEPIVYANARTLSAGDGVIVMGDLYGNGNTVGYGIVTANGAYVFKTDREYIGLSTSVPKQKNSFAIICDINGDMVGVQTSQNEWNSEGFCAGYTSNDIIEGIQNVANDTKVNRMGITGLTVTYDLETKYGFPQGVYVSDIVSGEAAFNAGIQNGDIITQIDSVSVKNMRDYMAALSGLPLGAQVTVRGKRKSMDSYKDVVFSFRRGVK